MTTVTIQVPDSLDLTAQRVQIGDSVEFIDKINTTQQNLELFSQQLTTFSSDLQQAVVVIDGIAAGSAQAAADNVQTILQNLVDQSTSLKDLADTARNSAQQYASDAQTEANRIAGLAATFNLPIEPALANGVLVQKPDASGLEYKLFDWSALPGKPNEIVTVTSDQTITAGYSKYFIAGDHTITLPAAPESSAGDQIRLTKSISAKPIVQAADGEQITMNNQSDQSLVFDMNAELILIFDNGWNV